MGKKTGKIVAVLGLGLLCSCSTIAGAEEEDIAVIVPTDSVTVHLDNYYGSKYAVFTTLAGDHIVEAENPSWMDGYDLTVSLPAYDTVILLNYTLDKKLRDSLGVIYATYNAPKVNRMALVDDAHYLVRGLIGIDYVDEDEYLLLPKE